MIAISVRMTSAATMATCPSCEFRGVDFSMPSSC
jgi:hypothetical protein